MPSYEAVFLSEAEREYEDSLRWYKDRSEKAAATFILNLGHTLSLICENPYSWPNRYKDYHELSVKRYPFSVVYYIDEANHQVVITSVFHHSRNPRKKYRKPKG